MSILFKAITVFIIVLLLLIPISFSSTGTTPNEKISSLLLRQVNLRKEQIANPTTGRLNQMKEMGMMVDNLEQQQIFIHLERELNDAQVKELKNSRKHIDKFH